MDFNTDKAMNEEIKNAIITSASITMKDQGVLDSWIFVDYGSGGGQGFGGYALYLPKSYSHHSIESVAGHFIYRAMEVAGVTEWDKMKGRSIRVKGSMKKISAIGHIIKDDWLNPEKDFAELDKKKND